MLPEVHLQQNSTDHAPNSVSFSRPSKANHQVTVHRCWVEASLCGFTSVYPLKNKLSFAGEKGVSLSLGSFRTTNDSAAIADSYFGVQGAYFT
jgi:hypothetical protein